MSTDPSIPPVPPVSEPPASPAVVPQVEDKTVAIFAYLTLVGFIVAIFLNNGAKKNELGQFHLRQALGLWMILFAVVLVLVLLGVFTLGFLVPVIVLLYWLSIVAVFALAVIGLIDAINGRMKPIPVVGKLIQQKLAGAFAS